MYCSHCGQRNEIQATYCIACGSNLHATQRVRYVPAHTNLVDNMIPLKNTPALIAYYLGVFSLAFWFLGIPAFILGIMGLKRAKADPAVKGENHAWVGIILGVLSTAALLIVVLSIVSEIMSGKF